MPREHAARASSPEHRSASSDAVDLHHVGAQGHHPVEIGRALPKSSIATVHAQAPIDRRPLRAAALRRRTRRRGSPRTRAGERARSSGSARPARAPTPRRCTAASGCTLRKSVRSPGIHARVVAQVQRAARPSRARRGSLRRRARSSSAGPSGVAVPARSRAPAPRSRGRRPRAARMGWKWLARLAPSQARLPPSPAAHQAPRRRARSRRRRCSSSLPAALNRRRPNPACIVALRREVWRATNAASERHFGRWAVTQRLRRAGERLHL